MNHEQGRLLLQGYVDGELDLRSSLELESHLSTCEICTGQYQDYLALHSALAADSLYRRAPAGLGRRIAASIRAEHQSAAASPRRSWLVAGLAGAVVVVAAAAFLIMRLVLAPPNALVDEIVTLRLGISV